MSADSAEMPTSSLPMLVILAGMSAPLAVFLGQIAKLAGWQISEKQDQTATLSACVRMGEEGLIVTHMGNETAFTLPVRASKIIHHLLLLKSGRLQSARNVSFGPYELIAQDFLLMDQAGQAVRLTEKEVAILLCLAKAQGQSVSRQTLLDDVWAYADGVETHTLETHIYRLRQKMEENPAMPQYLITRDDGYALAC